MKLAGVDSFNHGKEFVSERYPHLLVEINDIIRAVEASLYKTKASKEKTKNYHLYEIWKNVAARILIFQFSYSELMPNPTINARRVGTCSSH